MDGPLRVYKVILWWLKQRKHWRFVAAGEMDYLWLLEASQLETALPLVMLSVRTPSMWVCEAATASRVEANFLSVALALVAAVSENGKQTKLLPLQGQCSSGIAKDVSWPCVSRVSVSEVTMH